MSSTHLPDFAPRGTGSCGRRSKDTSSQPGGTRLRKKDGEGAASSSWQSTPPAHAIQARSNSALAWRRAPRARPDLNVLFVRLALGRSSPSASVRPAHACAAHHRGVSRGLQPTQGARMLACNSCRTCELVCSALCWEQRAACVRSMQGTRTTGSLHRAHACSVWHERGPRMKRWTGSAQMMQSVHSMHEHHGTLTCAGHGTHKGTWHL